MAGPTPVSSLMHAATMVTAGVYLVGRMFPFYQAEGFGAGLKPLILVIGALTLFLGGLLALVQNDIKKVLAYSTVSQLGYMMAAMGAGAYTAGLFHLFTHAFFKGLLFLAAGSVIHAVHSNNMSDMGGLRRYLPKTFWTFLIGSLALAGIVPLAGFWSKDEILASLAYDAQHGGGGLATFVLVLALAGAFITAFYMARVRQPDLLREVPGRGPSPRVAAGDDLPAHRLGGARRRGRVSSNMPGVVHAPSLRGWPPGRTPSWSTMPTGLNWGLAALGTLVALAGIAAGTALFGRNRATQKERDRFRIPALYPLLERKYYIDDLYDYGLVRPIRGPLARAANWSNNVIIDGAVNAFGVVARRLASLVYGGLDQRGIDLGFNAAAAVTGEAGGALRRVQTGKVQQYAAAPFPGGGASGSRVPDLRLEEGERHGLVRERVGAEPHRVPPPGGGGRGAGGPAAPGRRRSRPSPSASPPLPSPCR